MRHYGLTDQEWAMIVPFLPRDCHGVARIDSRCVINISAPEYCSSLLMVLELRVEITSARLD